MGTYNISQLQTQVDEIYDALGDMKDAIMDRGVSVSTTEPIANYASKINSIPGPKTEEKKVATYDANGSYTITPSEGNAISQVDITVDVQTANLQEKTFQPTVSTTEVIPDEGYDGLSKVTVSAVTSSIDSNIQAENIRKYITILGVAGTYEGSSAFQMPTGTKLSFQGSTFATPDFTGLQIANITSAVDMFRDCSSLTYIVGLDTSTITDMTRMFYNCTSLTTAPVNIDLTNCTNATSMFSYSGLTEPAHTYEWNRDVNMNYMYQGCSGLTTYSVVIDLSHAISTTGLFKGCSNLTSIAISYPKSGGLDTTFSACEALQSVNFDTNISYTAPSNLQATFAGCTALQSITNLDLTNASSVSQYIFGYSDLTNLTTLTLVGSLNYTISSDFHQLTALSFDSVKSILTAASNTTKTTAKTLTFNRTLTGLTSEQVSELDALVADCQGSTKNWTITGLTYSA